MKPKQILFSLPKEGNSTPKGPGDRITETDAITAIKAYHGLSDSKKLKSDDNKVIKGFIFKKTDLTGVLKNIGADKVVLAMAYHEKDIPPLVKKGFTMIMMGMDEVGTERKLMISDADGHKLFDYCEPIPPANTSPELDGL